MQLILKTHFVKLIIYIFLIDIKTNHCNNMS
jgi:hypothetical protein